MSSRFLAALAAGLILLTTACSGGDKIPGAAAPTDESEPSAPAAPKFTPFDEFPGGELKFFDHPAKPATRIKPVDSMWAADLAGVPADPGYHYLAVYLAVTGELADRGVENVQLKDLEIKYQPAGGKCGKTELFNNETSCFSESWPYSDLAKVADNTWREHKWEKSTVMGTDIKTGETVIGVAGFKVADNVDTTTFELCAPSKEQRTTRAKFPCVPIKATQPRAGQPSAAPQSGGSTFADYPGEHVVFTNMNEKLGVRVKPVDATWAAELMRKPARPGFHFLGVYVAVTPDLADRGVESVRLDRLAVRYPASAGGCDAAAGTSACFSSGRPVSRLDPVAKGEWRGHSWMEPPMGTTVKPGETLIGLAGFEIPDSVTGTDFKLCAPTPEAPIAQGDYPCVPITVPARG
ncbi:hypothetical protein [Amycolatopsis sp. NPDC059657]|uniref:hypothetical protein n=1 Tax=Amycolatopsis sp. NPDC059657 TaxID=3346899 RepID=UPI00366BF86B